MAGNSRLFDPRGLGPPPPKGHYWRVLQPWAYALVGLLVVAIVLALFYPAWKRGENTKIMAEMVQRELDQKKQELAELQDEAGRLRDDPYTVERMSRDTLGLARPGEVIFKFQPYRTNATAPSDTKRAPRGSEAMRKP
ncbi:MAG: septum formation initiator family protein [Verrucomicrobia bacterium]|nr:septum formation initiator family protein [Verrucomicrobiota bacterium]NBY67180.1 septum formation initiator family protein [Verrucomicrobiota bacterium]